MRVGFDISQIAHTGGVAIYTQNLAMELSRLTELEMVFFYSSLRKPYKNNLGLRGVKSYRLPPTLFETLFNKIRSVSIERFIGPVDVFHSSDWVQPPSKAKKVTTYHDVIPLMFSKWSHPKIVGVHKRRLKLVENEIDMVIAVSNATKQDLLRISNIPEEKITVIYEGVDEIFKPQKDQDIKEFKKKYGLPENYLLAVGGVGERKNLDRIKKACSGYELVILGQMGSNLARDELPLLYSGADLLVYASLYEGFGLPILEAMACGAPVVTSNVSSMPEIAGDGAVLVNPEDVSDIKLGIKRALAGKQDLVNRGKERVKLFSWKRCAEETARVYEDLVKDKS